MGKTLLGLAGYLSGYDGTFEFDSGKDYPNNVNFAGMRVFCGICGATIVPLAFLIGLELKMSRQAAFLLGVFALVGKSLIPKQTMHGEAIVHIVESYNLECSFATISRFILLDSMLLMFTATSTYCLVRFRNEQAARYECALLSILPFFTWFTFNRKLDHSRNPGGLGYFCLASA